MKNLTKLTALLMCFVMVLALAACGSSSGSSATAATTAAAGETAAAETEASASDFKFAVVIGVGGLGDGSFNDSLKEGADMACEAFGIDGYQLIEPTEVAEFEGHFTDLSASGEYDLIVAGGFDAIEAMSKVAAEFPDQKYLFVDGEVAGLDNVKSVTYRDNEKAYCLGIMAAMETESDTLGIVMALDIDSLRVFTSGFMAGALSVNPDMKFSIKVVGGFADTTTAKELAIAEQQEGIDIIYTVAGGSGLGCFAAAEETTGLRCIGVDVNQCLISPSVVMASGLRLMQNTVCNGIGAAMDGSFVGGAASEGIPEDALSFTVEGSECAPSDEAVAAAWAAFDAIKAGEITVPSTYAEVGYEG